MEVILFTHFFNMQGRPRTFDIPQVDMAQMTM